MTKRTRTTDEALYSLTQAIEVIELNCAAYHERIISAWIAISTQVYKLVIDRKPLALHVFPDLNLHPTNWYIADDNPSIMMDPAGFRVVNGIIVVRDLFNIQATPIPLKEWVNQNMLIRNYEKIKLVDIIKAGRDQEAAHWDQNIAPITDSIKTFASIRERGEDQVDPMLTKWTVAIGEYVAAELRRQVADRKTASPTE